MIAVRAVGVGIRCMDDLLPSLSIASTLPACGRRRKGPALNRHATGTPSPRLSAFAARL
jgi:hypothetical protein